MKTVHDGEGYLKGLLGLGLSAENVAVVEDSPSGITAAKAAWAQGNRCLPNCRSLGIAAFGSDCRVDLGRNFITCPINTESLKASTHLASSLRACQSVVTWQFPEVRDDEIIRCRHDVISNVVHTAPPARKNRGWFELHHETRVNRGSCVFVLGG